MNYGYALYYKDKEGYELPYIDKNEVINVFLNKGQADSYMVFKTNMIDGLIKPARTVHYTGFWIWRKEHVNVHQRVHGPELDFYKQFLNTAFIKRVKVV